MATCVMTGRQFSISPAEQEYCIQNGIPLPTMHPTERLWDLFVFCNRPYLYNAVCTYSQKEILSYIPPEKGFTVYDIDVRESDVWDGILKEVY